MRKPNYRFERAERETASSGQRRKKAAGGNGNGPCPKHLRKLINPARRRRAITARDRCRTRVRLGSANPRRTFRTDGGHCRRGAPVAKTRLFLTVSARQQACRRPRSKWLCRPVRSI